MARMSEKQLMLTIGVSAVLLSGASFGGVYWAQGWIEEEKTKITGLESKISEAAAKKARIEKDENEVIILRENVNEYVKILPETKDLTLFVRTINSFVQNSGVTLTSLTKANNRRNKKSAFTQFQYNLSFTGTLWQFIKFVNMFESYKRFVKISSFKLNAGRIQAGGTPDDVVHQFTMSVVTYTYNRSAGGKKPVKIEGYNKKRDRLREEIYRARQQIKIDRYSFKGQRARRDIFVDPRVDQTQNDPGNARGATLAQQLQKIEELTTEVKAIKQKWAQAEKTSILLLRYEMQRDCKRRLTAVTGEIEKVEQRGMINYRPYLLKFQREVREPRDSLFKLVFKSGAEQKVLGIPMDELTSIQRFMIDALTDGRLEDAIDKFELVQEKLIFPKGDERQAVAERLRDLYTKASVAQDFSRLDLKISGIILLDGGLSTAIINGKTYTEGDALQDKLFLKEIGPEYTEFLYRGVVLRKKRS